MAVRQASNGQLPGVLGRTISTELAVNAFGLMSGSFGALAGLIAAKRLETYTDEIPLGRLAVPVLVAGGSTVIGALLVPTGG